MSDKKKEATEAPAAGAMELVEAELKKGGSFLKKFLGEFKDFAMRGNVLNLAVGVIIGGAFQGVVSSLTENILSPIIGLFTGQNFDGLVLNIPLNLETGTGIVLKYGAFITSIINFIITAFVIFLLVRGMNKLASLGKKQEEEKPTTKKCPFCCTDIPLKATRCPNCTAELPQEAEPEPA